MKPESLLEYVKTHVLIITVFILLLMIFLIAILYIFFHKEPNSVRDIDELKKNQKSKVSTEIFKPTMVSSYDL